MLFFYFYICLSQTQNIEILKYHKKNSLFQHLQMNFKVFGEEIIL